MRVKLIQTVFFWLYCWNMGPTGKMHTSFSEKDFVGFGLAAAGFFPPPEGRKEIQDGSNACPVWTPGFSWLMSRFGEIKWRKMGLTTENHRLWCPYIYVYIIRWVDFYTLTLTLLLLPLFSSFFFLLPCKLTKPNKLKAENFSIRCSEKLRRRLFSEERAWSYLTSSYINMGLSPFQPNPRGLCCFLNHVFSSGSWNLSHLFQRNVYYICYFIIANWCQSWS